MFTGVDKPDPGDPEEQEPYNAYRYAGKRFDTATDTYDMGFRDYDPGLNRFLTRDMFNGALADLSLGSNPWTMSRYTFAGGNPTTLIEYDGHLVLADGGDGGGQRCSGRYCVGAARNPVDYGPGDDDFPYDPEATPTVEDYRNWTEWGIKGDLCVASARTNVGPCAGWIDPPYLYAHYREGLGTDYPIDYEHLYDVDQSIQEDVHEEIRMAQEAAEALLAVGDQFSMTSSSRNIGRNPMTEEAQKALGSYDMWSSAELTVTGDTIRMRLTVHAEDRWNFNRDAKDIETGTPDQVNGRFAELGWAQAFNTSGQLVRDVEWQIGSLSNPVVTPITEPSKSRFGW